MKKVVVLAFLVAAAGFAMPLDFRSLGTLSCGPGNPPGCAGGGSSLAFTNNGATLTLTYVSNQEINLNVPEPPDYVTNNFGTLNVQCTACGGMTATFMMTGATLSLGIEQINGTPFNAIEANMFTGTLDGSLSVTNGTSFGGSVAIVFSPLLGSLSNGGIVVTYVLQQPEAFWIVPAGYTLSIDNPTTLQGVIIDPPVTTPEPLSLTLSGFGVLAIEVLRRRARRNGREGQA